MNILRCLGILVLIMGLAGCISTTTYENRYRQAHQIAPMKVPAGTSKIKRADYYPVPSLSKKLPDQRPDLTPPGAKYLK